MFTGASRLLALTALVLATNGLAAEKIRFSAPVESGIQTRPERSIRESLTVPSEGMGLNSATRPAAGIIRPTAASAGVPQANNAADVDQRNWIFRDTRSTEGIQRALGVESYRPATASVSERDSTSVIHDYFSRQRAEKASRGNALGTPASGRFGASGETTSGFETDLEGKGLPTLVNPAVRKPDELFGQGTFRSTLNSDNLSVRRFYRDLYTSPSSGDASSPNSLSSPNRFGNPAPANTLLAPKGSPSFGDLAARAAQVESLSARPTPPLNSAAPGRPATLDPFRPSAPAPTVNNGKLLERRNGLTEIPSRRQ